MYVAYRSLVETGAVQAGQVRQLAERELAVYTLVPLLALAREVVAGRWRCNTIQMFTCYKYY